LPIKLLVIFNRCRLLQFRLFVLQLAVLVGCKIFLASTENDLKGCKISCCAIGGVEPVFECGREIVAIFGLLV